MKCEVTFLFLGIRIKGISEEPMRTFLFENSALMRGTLSCGGLVMMNIVTEKESSQYLKLSDSTIYKLASSGMLPGVKIGDSWRFDLDEIMTFIKMMKRGNGGRERDMNGKDGKRKWKS